MRGNNKMMLAAGLLAGAAMMTGCTAKMRPAVMSTPKATQQQTAQPTTAEPMAQTDEQETTKQLPLVVDGKETGAKTVKENGKLLLPLVATGEALGWKPQKKATEEETQTKHEITLEKDESRITVSYEVSDNTIRRISWQRDGLLVPVDTQIKRIEEAVYVPGAFFEEATGVRITEKQDMVEVSSPEPMDTPQINQ